MRCLIKRRRPEGLLRDSRKERFLPLRYHGLAKPPIAVLLNGTPEACEARCADCDSMLNARRISLGLFFGVRIHSGWIPISSNTALKFVDPSAMPMPAMM